MTLLGLPAFRVKAHSSPKPGTPCLPAPLAICLAHLMLFLTPGIFYLRASAQSSSITPMAFPLQGCDSSCPSFRSLIECYLLWDAFPKTLFEWRLSHTPTAHSPHTPVIHLKSCHLRPGIFLLLCPHLLLKIREVQERRARSTHGLYQLREWLAQPA